MNTICLNCDTRKRLKLCQGKDGDFKYCYRSSGGLTRAKNTISPFNTLNELYNIINKKDGILEIKKNSLKIDFNYANNHNLGLLLGIYTHQSNIECVIGYISY